MRLINYIIIIVLISSIAIAGTPVGPEIGTCLNPPCSNCSCSIDTCIGQTCNSGQCAGEKVCTAGNQTDGENNSTINITIEDNQTSNNGGGGGSHASNNTTITVATPCTGAVTSCPNWPDCQSGEKRQYRTCTTDCNTTFEDYRDCPKEGETPTAAEPVVTPPTEPEVIVYPPEGEKQWQWWEIIPWTTVKQGLYTIIIVILIFLILRIFYKFFKNRKLQKINEKIIEEHKPKKEAFLRECKTIYKEHPIQEPIIPPCFIPPEERTFLDEQPIEEKQEFSELQKLEEFIKTEDEKLKMLLGKSREQYGNLNQVDKTMNRLAIRMHNAKVKLEEAKNKLNRK